MYAKITMHAGSICVKRAFQNRRGGGKFSPKVPKKWHKNRISEKTTNDMTIIVSIQVEEY